MPFQKKDAATTGASMEGRFSFGGFKNTIMNLNDLMQECCIFDINMNFNRNNTILKFIKM